MTLKYISSPIPFLLDIVEKRVGCRNASVEGLWKHRLEPVLVQISVIVANIQTNYMMN